MPEFGAAVDDTTYALENERMLEVARSLKHALEVDEMIDELADEHGIHLLPGAYIVLSAALMDAAYAQNRRRQLGVFDDSLDVDMIDVRRTIGNLIRDTAREPAMADTIPDELSGSDESGEQRPLRSALSMIKAMANRFCSIPPICSERR